MPVSWSFLSFFLDTRNKAKSIRRGEEKKIKERKVEEASERKEPRIMLAASMCRDLHFTVLPSTLGSTVPRCLFGPPNAKETVDLLHEALEMERSKFARRWGVDPRSEDKENFSKSKHERGEKSPRKRSSPYSRQSSIHGEFDAP